ncbi:hypothetical protein [Streptomyces zingiberis]|uniref:Uncharacterized protein n=1 Tax=Streptomyces zingiberis TaxID=2053010 RepID=A0ABX1BXM0_9ACTN|nr:hypothetical protein [Streptomyces zingiberis]NJQ00237.1 hypothetical protein [Streptomyces zingiberis]
MRSLKRPGRGHRAQAVTAVEPQGLGPADGEEDGQDHETYEMFRVTCPDCARPIALLADEEALPEHALCASPWNPFGLTVCPGTGRSVEETAPASEGSEVQEQAAALLLTLPQGLDWRTQPFSHIGGPGSRPFRLPPMRQTA